MQSNYFNPRIYGYVRISSESQEFNSSIQTQSEELMKKGVPETQILVEIGSAVNEIKTRPILYDLIHNRLQAGDTLMITKIDRVARNILEFLKLQDLLTKKKINFISLDLPYGENAETNKLITGILCLMAEFENDRRRERQQKGIKIAKAAGKYKGRKSVIDDKLISEVRQLKKKNLSVTQIVKITGKSRNTIYKVLKQHLGYVNNRLVKSENKDLSK